MERHQVGQGEKLVEVTLEVVPQPRGSPVDHRGCFKCMVALATVMGLVIVALVAGFIVHHFMFTPSCNQDAPPLSDAAKVNITCNLKKSDQQWTYEIFTVDKTATYLIYGWVKLTDITSEEIVLMQKLNENKRTIQKKKEEGKREISFFDKVYLANNISIIIYFKSAYTDSLFHVYEL